jgi:hypothetical protein
LGAQVLINEKWYQAFAIKRRIGGDEGADDDGDHHGGQESRADPEHPLLSRLNTKM